MPRVSRIDWFGAVHHVIARGIEKRDIFLDDRDRFVFVQRLKKCVIETEVGILAWSLMPNHIHLLIRTNHVPLSKFMHRLLTGHAVYFNRKHERVGHLFQNRYLSILVQNEKYMLKLVHYIHRNPLKAGIVSSIDMLNEYPWTGHLGLLKNSLYIWMDTESVLKELCGNNPTISLHEFMNTPEDDNASLFDTGTFMLGTEGIIPSTVVDSGHNASSGQFGVLGDLDFAKFVYQRVRSNRKGVLRDRASQHESITTIIDHVADMFGLSSDLVVSGSRLPEVIRAREYAAFSLTRYLGLKYVDCGRILNISAEGVRVAARRFSENNDHESVMQELNDLIG